jgi:hypothetical protein
VTRDEHGVIALRAAEGAALRLLPLCASFAEADAPWSPHAAPELGPDSAPSSRCTCILLVERADTGVGAGGVQLPLERLDPDRASGWVVAERAALLGCSPWGIDSEERMSRLLNGWIHRTTVPRYPAHEKVRDLPTPPTTWGWLRYDGIHLVALQAPTPERARRRGHMGSRDRRLPARHSRA